MQLGLQEDDVDCAFCESVFFSLEEICFEDPELFCVVLNSLNGITSCSIKISVLVFFCIRFRTQSSTLLI